MEDRKIVRLFFDRDEAALREVSAKYGAYCASIARNILNNREDAEECVNDTYLRAWESIPPKDPPVLGAFLGRITKNLALDRIKFSSCQKRGGNEEIVSFDELDDFVSDGNSVEDAEERREMLAAINDFLRGLTPKKRKLFVARYWGFYKLSELAERFGMSENSVTVEIGRTRKRLREYLTKRGFEL